MKLLAIHRRAAIWLALVTCPVLHADVTMRYTTDVKLNPTLPPQMAAQFTKALGGVLGQDSTARFRGDKGYASSAAGISIVDFVKKEITMIDPARKRFAAVAESQWTDELAKAMTKVQPEAQPGMQSMKSSFDSKATGRTAEILGVQVEEREVSISIDGPSMPEAPAGPMMRIVIQFWVSKPSEAIRVQAIREVVGYALWNHATLNPGAAAEKMFQQMPGFGDGFGKLMKEMQSTHNVILKMHLEIFMPWMAAMLEKQNPTGAAMDGSLPLIQVNQELSELSTAPIADSVFQVPPGFEPAPIGEMVQAIVAKYQGAMKQ